MNKELLDGIEYLDKVKDAFKEQDPDLKLNSKFFSAAALNPFMDHTSSPRGIMFSSHMSQPVVIEDPDVNMVQSGLETDFGEHSISKYVDEPSEVVGVAKRYNVLGKENINVETTVIYRNLTTGMLDALEIPSYNKLHPYFGFKFNREKLSEVSIGDTITSDDKLAVPPSNISDTDYGFGKDLNMVQMTHPLVDEDGFVISESCAKKFKFRVYDTRIIEVGENSYLLNLYGDKDEYKSLPDIGEKISDTGAIAATRKYDESFSPMLMGVEDVRTFNPIFDNAVYGRRPTSRVVDIKVYKNNRKRKTLPTHTEQFCEMYHNRLVDYYQQIINIYDSVNQANKRAFGKELEVGNTLYTLLIEAYGIVESSKDGSRLRKKYRKDNVDRYRIEITTETVFNQLEVGHKITDCHGGKGTIVSILPDALMPRDKNGVVADILADPKSTISRLNIGRLYEMYTKAALLKVTRLIKEYIGKIDKDLNIQNITDEELKGAFAILVDFVSIIGNEYSAALKETLDSNNIDDMESVISEVLETGVRIYLPLDNDKRKYEIVNDIVKSKYAPDEDKLYMDGTEREETVDNILVTPIYMFMLSKIADSTLATSSSKVNHFGLPVVANKNDKYSLPHKNSPGRFLGETETRILTAYTDPKFAAEFRDRNASIETHKEVYHNILTADKPTNIETLVDREKIKYGGDRGLEILRSLWNSVGFDLEYVKDQHPTYEYQEKDGLSNLAADELEAIEELDINND